MDCPVGSRGDDFCRDRNEVWIVRRGDQHVIDRVHPVAWTDARVPAWTEGSDLSDLELLAARLGRDSKRVTSTGFDQGQLAECHGGDEHNQCDPPSLCTTCSKQ